MPPYVKSPLKVTGLVSATFGAAFLTVVFLGWLVWRLPGLEQSTAPQEEVATLKNTRTGHHPGVRLVGDHVHRVKEWDPSRPRFFSESPLLRPLVERDALPPVEKRLPENPLVIVPPDRIGPYGGTWRRSGTSVNDIGTAWNRITYEGLIRWDASGNNMLPNLAASWEIGDRGRTYTFHLRRGIRWSDGEPFTADDILFWYDHVLKNSEITPVAPSFLRRSGEFAELDRLDSHTIRFRFAEADGLFLERLASGHSLLMVNFPRHYMKQFHPDFVPEDELRATARQANFLMWSQYFMNRAEWRNPEKPRLDAWVMTRPPPAATVVFERNPYYWKVDTEGNQLPYIDRVTFDIRTMDILNLKMLSGDIDMQGRHAEFSNYPLFIERQNEENRFRVLEWPPASGGRLALAPNINHGDPEIAALLRDARFRKALSLAIDRHSINEIAFLGLATPRQMAPPPGSLFYDSAYESSYIEFDLERANRILDEMGLTERNNHGFRLLPDGRPIHLQIELTQFINEPAAFLIVSDGWRQLGLSVRVREQARELFIRRIHARQHDFAVWGGSDEQNPLMDPRWFIPFSPSSFHAVSYAQWYETRGRRGDEPAGDIRRCIELFWEIEETIDPGRRIELFQKIIDLNRKNLWVINLLGGIPDIHIVSNRMRNVPDRAVSGWIYRTPGNTAPECYSMDP